MNIINVLCLVEIDPVVLNKKIENVKSLWIDEQTDRQMNGQTDDRQMWSEKLT